MKTFATLFLLILDVAFVMAQNVLAPPNVKPEKVFSESSEFCDDNPNYLGFPCKLYFQSPQRILRNKPIPAASITITTRIDTFKIDYKYDSLSSPVAFTFKKDKNSFDQYVAIQRKNDWVIIYWDIFRLAAPAGLKLDWIYFNTSSYPMLLLKLDRTGDDTNVSSHLGVSNRVYIDDKITTYNYRWTQAAGYCLIDVNNLSLVLDNVYTGFEYSYDEEYELREKPLNPEQYYSEYMYATYRQLTRTMNVWYDFAFNAKENTITISKKRCSERILDDNSLVYSDEKLNETKGKVGAKSVKELDAPNCREILKEGVYQLKDGMFVLQ